MMMMDEEGSTSPRLSERRTKKQVVQRGRRYVTSEQLTEAISSGRQQKEEDIESRRV